LAAELNGCKLTQLRACRAEIDKNGGGKQQCGIIKKNQNAHLNQGKTPPGKPGSVTRLFREYTDCMAGAEESNMAPTAAHPDSELQSPTTSDISSNANDLDLKEILRKLPSRTDLAQMLGKLETTFQHKMEGLRTEI
ncbi:Hypothetical predicted protein, partial [Pelobates cultripes]